MILRKRVILLLLSLGLTGFMQATPTLTVFIHGTVLWYLALTSPGWLSEGQAERGGWYETLLNTRRDRPALFERKLMLEKGFKEIPRSLLDAARKGNLSEQRARFGCYYMIAGYDLIARDIGFASEDDHYALFGWSGMNTQTARCNAAVDLYQDLCDWREDYYQRHGVLPDIRIHAYSHAGNVALGLCEAERVYKRGLSIKQLCLLATPIQAETASYIVSPLCKSIVLLRSPEGDTIQTMDTFSTALGESFASMAEVVDLKRFKYQNPQLHRVDAGVWVNRDGRAIDHFNFFELEARPIHSILAPLPLIVLAPAILQHINERPEQVALRVRLLCDDGALRVQVKSARDFYTEPLGESEDLFDLVESIKNFTCRYWKPQSKKLAQRLSSAYRKFMQAIDIFDDDDDFNFYAE